MYKKVYFYLAILLVISIGFAIPGCGGGGNNGTLPVTNTNASIDSTPSVVTSTPTPVLENVSVSGYIYAGNTVTEDGEIIPCINVLDVPACQVDSAGNQPFTEQFSNSLKADYPEDWAKPDVQELYTQLNKTLSESKPLPECNGQVYSVYNDVSIPVGSDGHFDNTVLTGASDSNVKLEVALGEDNYAEVETLPSMGNISSSDATNAVLKSCPEKIFAFPGEIVIFKIQAEPGINLKSAGLKFTLNNPSIGCITQPVYLCVFGAHKYQVAYGCLYIKHGLNTPLDTTITAKLNSGQSMSIFLEVIKKTASVSGTVYTGGSPLVKGYVKSLGPKACCKIDSSGNYSLPKVFMGHSRSVIATWYTEENGQKVRHREEKVIDFFNSNLTGFYFGMPPTPTPTFTPSATPTPRDAGDPYYDKGISLMLRQYINWEKQVGTEMAIQNVINWINSNNIPDTPVPNGITKVIRDDYDDGLIWIYFNDGMSMCVAIKNDLVPPVDIDPNLVINSLNLIANASTVGSSKILILAPYYQQQLILGLSDPNTVHDRIAKELIAKGYDVTFKNFLFPYITVNDKFFDINTPRGWQVIITDYTINKLSDFYKGTPLENIWEQQKALIETLKDKPYENEGNLKIALVELGIDEDIQDKMDYYLERDDTGGPPSTAGSPIRLLDINPEYESYIVTLDDYLDLKKYGIIYVFTHGARFGLQNNRTSGILASFYYQNDPTSRSWMEHHLQEKYDPLYEPKGTWYYYYQYSLETHNTYKGVALTDYFFKKQSYNNSLVYMNTCYSWDFKDSFINNGTRAYLGHTEASDMQWSFNASFMFFYYMMYGIPNIDIPMSVQQSFQKLENENMTTRLNLSGELCELKMEAKDGDTYFPVPVTITIEKTKKSK